MKEIDKLFIAKGGYIVLKDVDGQHYTLETFRDIDTQQTVIRAFQAELSHPLRPQTDVTKN